MFFKITFAAFFLSLIVSCTPKATFNSTDKKKDYTLPDGTLVTLNAQSSIKYDKTFEERIITIEGEAYIKLAYVEDARFTVVCNRMRFDLTGDEFYVNTNKETGKIRFVAIDGWARGELIGMTGQNVATIEEGWELQASTKDNLLQKSAVEDFYFLNWYNEAVVFDHKKLSEIADFLKKEYDIDVKTTNDKVLMNCEITDTFTFNKPEMMIQKIADDLACQLTKTDKSYILVGEGCGE